MGHFFSLYEVPGPLKCGGGSCYFTPAYSAPIIYIHIYMLTGHSLTQTFDLFTASTDPPVCFDNKCRPYTSAHIVNKLCLLFYIDYT